MADQARRVLVVEDEMMAALLLQSMLDRLGCVIVGPAARIDQALRLIDEAVPACAILDVNLGGRPAFAIAERLEARDIPFAFVTGYDSTQLPPAWRNRPLLQKPFTRDQLGAVLAHL
jgi:CheY-like chemotaxis protein